MKNILKLALLLQLFAGVHAFASHIIGGVVNYQHLGGDQYAMTIIIYRDCSSAVAFANPLVLNAFTIDGNLYDNFSIPNPTITIVEQPVLPPCAIAPTDVCVQQAIYQSTITLPPTPGGYSLMYTVCCRNGNILNIESPDATSSSFVATLPADTSIDNSNAVFNEFPPTFICKDTPLSFDHSATDADGDSLVYSFCAPSDGVAIGGTPSAPPYPDVTWVAGFDANNPIDASVPFQINPISGLLTGTPDVPGRYVVGVCVSEYRNGVLITTTKRDIQFNVVACQNTIASFPQILSSCSGPTITFSNNSSNFSSYFWDFGVPGVNTDTSSLATPTFTYPDTGTYVITLIAYNNTGAGSCTDTVTEVNIVRPLLDASINPSVVSVGNGSNAQVSVQVNNSAAAIQWQTNANNIGWHNLPNNATYSTNGNTLTVSNIQIGNHMQSFRVIATNNACADTSNIVHIHVSDTCINSITVYDTLTTYTTVTDTLLIYATLTSQNPPNNANIIKVFPNPSNDHITIHYGNFGLMSGYQLRIENSLGQQVFQTNITQQSDYLSLTNWGGNGLYYVHLINPQGNTIDIRKIVLQ